MGGRLGEGDFADRSPFHMVISNCDIIFELTIDTFASIIDEIYYVIIHMPRVWPMNVC